MLKLWHDLKKEFYPRGEEDQATRYVELIAMLIFWWIYKQELETSSRQKLSERSLALKRIRCNSVQTENSAY